MLGIRAVALGNALMGRLAQRGACVMCVLGITTVANPAMADSDYAFRVESLRHGTATELLARNDGPIPVSLIVELQNAENIASDVAWPVIQVIPPRSQVRLGRLSPANPSYGSSYSYQSSYRLGSFHAVHDPSARYRMPYLGGRSFFISQAADGPLTTHTEPDSRHAIDIPMPEGTPILAARGGIVLSSISKYSDGAKIKALLGQANGVRILHADGTIATYAHLMPGGTSVQVGDVVAAGKLIGYAGSTGYSSGPHLHLVVNRVVRQGTQLVEVSEPMVLYIGNPPYEFAPRTGLMVTANYVSRGRPPELMTVKREDQTQKEFIGIRAEIPGETRLPASQPGAQVIRGPQIVIEVPVPLFAFWAQWWWAVALAFLVILLAMQLRPQRTSFQDFRREPTFRSTRSESDRFDR